jgi:hypothetical protein
MIKGYKGFNSKLQCDPKGNNPFQYEVGKTFEQIGDISTCHNGLHFCENPFDVFGYYNPADSRFCEVSADGTTEKDEDKSATSKLTIKAEIGLHGIIEAGVKFILEKVDFKDKKESNTGNRSAATNTGYQSAATNTGDRSAATNTGYQSAATNTGYQSAATNTGYQSAATNTGDQSAATNTGDQSAATNTGNQSAATNTGDQSAATNTGDQSAATNTGDQSAATNTGYRSAATNTGYQSAATNTGNRSAATNTGNQSAATNTGDQSAATNTGDRSAATVSGKESVAVSLGIEGKAKGALGCWIVLAEWYKDGNYDWHKKEVKTACVDGEIIKVDTFYMLKDGNFVETEDKL